MVTTYGFCFQIAAFNNPWKFSMLQSHVSFFSHFFVLRGEKGVEPNH